MKITKVETIVVTMPMIIEGPAVPRQGGTPRTSMDTLLVRIDTDEGVSGWGEGFGHRIFTATKAALDSFIGPMCVGRDPTAISTLSDELPRTIINALSREVGRILRLPDVTERIASQGATPRPTTPEEFDRFVRDDIVARGKVFKASGAKAE